MTPHEAGFTELGVFLETSLLGSKFQGGEVLEKKPEMDMIELQGGCWQSELSCSMETVECWEQQLIYTETGWNWNKKFKRMYGSS